MKIYISGYLVRYTSENNHGNGNAAIFLEAAVSFLEAIDLLFHFIGCEIINEIKLVDNSLIVITTTSVKKNEVIYNLKRNVLYIKDLN
jgi:hypothetical protein